MLLVLGYICHRMPVCADAPPVMASVYAPVMASVYAPVMASVYVPVMASVCVASPCSLLLVQALQMYGEGRPLAKTGEGEEGHMYRKILNNHAMILLDLGEHDHSQVWHRSPKPIPIPSQVQRRVKACLHD